MKRSLINGTGTPLSPRANAALAGVAAILAATAAAVSLANGDAEQRVFWAVANASAVGMLFAAGLAAWRRDPENRFGPVLVTVGFLAFFVALAASDSPALYSIGRVGAWIEEAMLIYLFLSYPTGRVQGRAARAVVGLAAATVTFLCIPSAFFVEQFPEPSPWSPCIDCPGNAFAITGSEPAIFDSVIRPLREAFASTAFLATGVILALRVRRATPLMRRTLAPVLAAAAAGAVAAFAYVLARRVGADDGTLVALGQVRLLMTPLAALGFLAGLAAWELYEAKALERLALSQAWSAPPQELQPLLSEALEDPTLEIRFRAGERWLDTNGAPADVPAASDDRLVMDLGPAVILCDSAFSIKKRLVQAVGGWVSTATERERLNRLLDDSLREVGQSRNRLATAAATERRRIERDLHDGAQQRLVTLRVQLKLAEDELQRDPTAGVRRLAELGPSIDAVIEEVRSLARGIYPPLLADAGISEALRAATSSSALPVTLAINDGFRYPLEVESAVYFCCLEALQNAAKHSRADSVLISLQCRDDGVSFEVRDDGAGFSPATPGDGAGLTNMRDRLAAAGGRLTIESSPGDGTRVAGEVTTAASS